MVVVAVAVAVAVSTVTSWVLIWAVTPSAAGASASHRLAAAGAVAHGPDWQGARTVDYCVEGGQPLLMTLFAPSTTGHPVPTVLQVHGGGWQKGSRLLSLSQSGTAADLVSAGFVVASIDYRLAPGKPWPDQIIDVKCAVRYLRSHAAGLGIEPDRIAALGTSAGGQLVSLLGTTGALSQWDTGPYLDVSSQVEAVVDEYGPSDLTATDWPLYTAGIIRQVFGAGPDTADPVLTVASPITHVSAGDPPFMIVQGTSDQVVPVNQSERLADRLRSAGVPTDLVLVARGRHGLGTPDEVPSASAISSMVTAFCERELDG
jgi:acetyl esterase/lipase